MWSLTNIPKSMITIVDYFEILHIHLKNILFFILYFNLLYFFGFGVWEFFYIKISTPIDQYRSSLVTQFVNNIITIFELITMIANGWITVYIHNTLTLYYCIACFYHYCYSKSKDRLVYCCILRCIIIII